MSLQQLRKEISELRIAAEAKRRANVYEPSCQFSPWLKYCDAAWRAELESAIDNRYDWLLKNLHRKPKYPLKPEYAAMIATESGVQRLYDLVKP